MKKLLKSLMLFAAAAMALTSCENEAMNEGIEANDTVTMTFVAGAPESKTSVRIDGDTATYTWSTGDKVGFYYVDVNGNYKKKSNSKEAAFGEKNTATFEVSFEQYKVNNTVVETNYNVGAFYPGDSWVSHVEENPFNNVKVEIKAGQSLTEGTFDPKADLMIAYPFMDIELESDNTKTLNFHRIAAIGKMNLKLDGMESDEIIKSVKFSLAEGTHFNGPVFLDMENSTYTLGTEDTSNYVTIEGELAANADRTAIFFTCFPGEYSGAYTIEVKTDKATYKKNGNLNTALKFQEGDVTNFNATVGDREKEVVEEGSTVDVLNRALTGATSTTYISWSGKTGASGAVYAGNSAGGNDAIQLRKSSSSQAKSGIITTTSGGNAKKVVVAWNSNTASDRTLTVYGKTTAYESVDDLYNSNKRGTSIGTISHSKGETELIIEGDYTYIGLAASSAMYLSEIQITWAGAGQGGETPDPTPDPEPEPDPTPDPEEPEGGESATYTWNLASGDLKTTEGSITKGEPAISWSQTNATYIGWDGSTNKGVQIGKGTDATTSFELSTSAIKGTIKKITVNASIASSGTAKLSVSVGGTDYMTSQALTTTATAYEATGNNSGDIKISFSNTAKAFYLKSVVIEYTTGNEGGSTEPDPTPDPVQLEMSSVSCSDNRVNENSLTFSWSAVANASNYEVTFDGKTTTQNATTFTATGLTAGTEYTISVVAKGDGTNYTDSAAATAKGTTKAATSGSTKKTYTLTISTSSFNTTSYAANNTTKTTKAVCSDGSTMDVQWTSNQVMLQSSVMQWQKNTGYIYNNTDLGTITNVKVNSSAGTFTVYKGSSQQPTSNVTGGYFQIKVGGATGKTTSIVVTFEK